MQAGQTIEVYYAGGEEKILVGKLASKARKIFFEYDPNFLQSNLELSPLKLPLKAGVIVCEDRMFDGLFGVFYDSLPDGWGRLLLDRKLKKININPGSLTPLERLCYVGSHGMGALCYAPELIDFTAEQHHNLDLLARECWQIQAHDDERFIDELWAMNGSSAGARPKILVNLSKDSFQATDNQNPSSEDAWIIKFQSSSDSKDNGAIEYAYHLMAIAAGLDVPPARLFKSKKTAGYFGVKRFDRDQGKRLHMQSACGLLHADYRLPSLDYTELLKTTLWLTKDIQQCEKQFYHIVFNILAHNRDDHAKNFSFLMDEKGRWRVSPAYDLIYSTGPAGEHSTMVMGEGKNPTLSHLLALAAMAGLSKQKAIQIIETVKNAVARWPQIASEANVSKKSSQMIQSTLNKLSKQFN